VINKGVGEGAGVLLGCGVGVGAARLQASARRTAPSRMKMKGYFLGAGGPEGVGESIGGGKVWTRWPVSGLAASAGRMVWGKAHSQTMMARLRAVTARSRMGKSAAG
jgi:hypothetical protein